MHLRTVLLSERVLFYNHTQYCAVLTALYSVKPTSFFPLPPAALQQADKWLLSKQCYVYPAIVMGDVAAEGKKQTPSLLFRDKIYMCHMQADKIFRLQVRL